MKGLTSRARFAFWRYLVRRLARTHGFLDPLALFTQLQRFAQPAEVAVPLELLRAGALFHARGLMNTKAIQHNLDWVWPFWVEEQFDPEGESFIPRAFSITHVNLTHRNWTAVGAPDRDRFIVVDPRGLVMPLWDSWSIDCWIVGSTDALIPSRAKSAVEQELEHPLAVSTRVREKGMELTSTVRAEAWGDELTCCIEVKARSDEAADLVISLRPYNPEGVSFISHIAVDEKARMFTVNDRDRVLFHDRWERTVLSDYRTGDVYTQLRDDPLADRFCEVGMVTAAAVFPLTPGEERSIRVDVPLERERSELSWHSVLDGACRFKVPDEKFGFLYRAALQSLTLLSAGELVPGPFTYRRFWFRDAAFMCEALLAVGLEDRVARIIESYWKRQTALGYFLSQEGEWDSNGAVLWGVYRYCLLTGERPAPHWKTPLVRGAEWIVKRRLTGAAGLLHEGLMPAGFSAEHLGSNDYYYWDNFWSVSGLECGSWFAREYGEEPQRGIFAEAARDLRSAIDRSIPVGNPISASPYRRLDSGAIGSLAASYPLRLWEAREPRLMRTFEFLLERCLVGGGFFQDMIHSGINPYLTLHLAQVLLRAEDKRYFELVQTVADLASSTGQWPEAIHPRTKGGCMGDGHHGWASAEWVLMMRSLFVCEEGERLIVGAGIPAKWLADGEALFFGPTPTRFGTLSVSVRPRGGEIHVEWAARWRDAVPPVEVRLPGHSPVNVSGDVGRVSVPQ